MCGVLCVSVSIIWLFFVCFGGAVSRVLQQIMANEIGATVRAQTPKYSMTLAAYYNQSDRFRVTDCTVMPGWTPDATQVECTIPRYWTTDPRDKGTATRWLLLAMRRRANDDE